MGLSKKTKEYIENHRNSRTVTPKSECPKCRRVLAAASTFEGPDLKPRPGDCTICAYCNAILEFDQNLALIPASDSKLVELAGSESFVVSNQVIAHVNRDAKKDRK